jgi:hypothetical protein
LQVANALPLLSLVAGSSHFLQSQRPIHVKIHLAIRPVLAHKSAAWYYPTPTAAASNIAGYVSFWRGVQVVEVPDA